MTNLNFLHVLCYRWGTRYPAEEVNILRVMVARHLSVPHQFHCITDDPKGLDPHINVWPLPDEGIDGIWRKLGTFRQNFLGLEGQHVVSFDIDVVITSSLDFLAERPECDLLIARNWSRKPGGAQGSGTLYRLKIGSHAHVWDRFIEDPKAAIDKHHGKTRMIGEQNWLQHQVGDFMFLPEGKVVSFKRHCKAKGRNILGVNTAWFGRATVPPGAAVVSFHGDPLPRDVMDRPNGRWRHAPFVRKHWR